MIHFELYTSTTQLPLEWNALITHDLFLQITYLKALEESAPRTISIYYVGVFNADHLVGIAIVQRVKLYAKDMFRRASTSKLKALLKDGLSRILKGNILVIGNLTHTGQHGMYFKSELISQSEFLDTLFKGIDELKIHIKEKDHKSIRAILFKDFFETDSIHESNHPFLNQGFYWE